jgi:hypothetical protein
VRRLCLPWLFAALAAWVPAVCWAQADQASNLPAALERAAIHSDHRALRRLMTPSLVARLNQTARSDLVSTLILKADLDGLTLAIRSGVAANQTIYAEADGEQLQVTALNFALGATADFRVATRLIALGADVNGVARDDDPPLHTAIKIGWLDLIEPLLARGANAQSRSTLFGTTPLMQLFHAEQDMARAEPAALSLLAHGAQIDERSTQGLTALMAAANNGNEPGVRWLLAHGADPRLTAQNGETALAMAKRPSLFTNSAIVELLEGSSAGATSAQELP